jgi:L-asparaginase
MTILFVDFSVVIHTGTKDTRLLTLRLVPGFDDGVIRQLIKSSVESDALKVLVLQLYGTGNIPTVKESFVQLLADASEKGILVIASTQCFTGSVLLGNCRDGLHTFTSIDDFKLTQYYFPCIIQGHYATGLALKEAGVVSAHDMTLEAISCKAAYLLG